MPQTTGSPAVRELQGHGRHNLTERAPLTPSTKRSVRAANSERIPRSDDGNLPSPDLAFTEFQQLAALRHCPVCP